MLLCFLPLQRPSNISHISLKNITGIKAHNLIPQIITSVFQCYMATQIHDNQPSTKKDRNEYVHRKMKRSPSTMCKQGEII